MKTVDFFSVSQYPMFLALELDGFNKCRHRKFWKMNFFWKITFPHHDYNINKNLRYIVIVITRDQRGFPKRLEVEKKKLSKKKWREKIWLSSFYAPLKFMDIESDLQISSWCNSHSIILSRNSGAWPPSDPLFFFFQNIFRTNLRSRSLIPEQYYSHSIQHYYCHYKLCSSESSNNKSVY